MERKLASIVKILDVKPIPNADAIEVAKVKGWEVVVKKNEYKPNDLAVYYEIDSFLPVRPEFEFLRKSSYKKLVNGEEGFRLSTVKLRGQLSQGLLTPVPASITNPVEDQDLTELLGIVKYEPAIPAQLAGEAVGNFPSFVPKTEEERIQNFSEDAVNLMLNKRCYVTEKLEGTSFTCFFKKNYRDQENYFGVCGRNWELRDTEGNTYWQVAHSLDLKNKLINLGREIAIQGEIIGPNIQDNIYKLKKAELYIFTAYDIAERRRLTMEELEQVAVLVGAKTVPFLHKDFYLPTSNTQSTMLAVADGWSELNSNVEREGIVVRAVDSSFSFKAISNVYLLKKK